MCWFMAIGERSQQIGAWKTTTMVVSVCEDWYCEHPWSAQTCCRTSRGVGFEAGLQHLNLLNLLVALGHFFSPCEFLKPRVKLCRLFLRWNSATWDFFQSTLMAVGFTSMGIAPPHGTHGTPMAVAGVPEPLETAWETVSATWTWKVGEKTGLFVRLLHAIMIFPPPYDPYFTRWVFPDMGDPQNGWFIMENPIQLDTLEVPPLQESRKPPCLASIYQQ